MTARVARLDPALGVRVVGMRELRYTAPAASEDDRPPHVRAASGLAFLGGKLAVIQDDAAFIATVARDEIGAIALPRGAGGRRRFEVGLGNKLEKLDLEACVAVGDELWAFGSGSAPVRERIAVIGDATRVHEAAPLYRRVREELGGAINLEGAAAVGGELWLFHRGNTGPGDRGAAIVRLECAALGRWLHGTGPLPELAGSSRFDLGSIGGVRLGFTDAAPAGGRVFYLAAAEASPNAIDDGRVIGSQLGVIDGDGGRAAALEHGGAPLKAEGLAFDPHDPRRAWIAIDPDDIDHPAALCELELVGPW